MRITATVTLTLAVDLYFDPPFTDVAELKAAAIDQFLDDLAMGNTEQILENCIDRVEYEIEPDAPGGGGPPYDAATATGMYDRDY